MGVETGVGVGVGVVVSSGDDVGVSAVKPGVVSTGILVSLGLFAEHETKIIDAMIIIAVIPKILFIMLFSFLSDII